MKRNNIIVKRGDVFLSKNPMWLGRVINWAQSWNAEDRTSEYSHAGIILNTEGKTLESLWTVKSQNLWEAYGGGQVLIVRPTELSANDKNTGLCAIKSHIGQFYPFYRCLLLLYPPLARRITFNRIVCSELVCKYLAAAGMDVVWQGKTPDNIHDKVVDSKQWEIIYEGKI